MKRKLLTALASTAGLAAVVAPSACMTSCGQKLHVSASKTKAALTEDVLSFEVNCSSLSEEEQVAVGGIVAFLKRDGKTIPISSEKILTISTWIKKGAPGEYEHSLSDIFGSVLKKDDKIAIEFVCLCMNTKEYTSSWHEYITINFVVEE